MDLLSFKNTTQALEISQNSDYKPEIMNYIISRIDEAICEKETSIALFHYEEENIFHVIFTYDYIKALEKATEYFIEIESYEKCAEIKNIIDNKLNPFLKDLKNNEDRNIN